MSKRSDTEETSTAPAGAAEPATAAAPQTEVQIDLALVEAPKIETKTETAAKIEAVDVAMASIEALKLELPKPDEIKPTVADAPSAAGETPSAAIIAAVADKAAPARTNRFALLAASVAFAAAFGALAGAFGASSLSQPAPATAATLPEPALAPFAAAEIGALQETIAKLRTEVAVLKTSVEAATRNANAQFSKIADRLERRADLAPATTGSVTPPQPAAAVAAALPPQPPQPPIVEGWVVRDVYRGIAIIQGRRVGMIEVEAGDVLPGVGRIESIRKQDGRWVVVTSKGLITSVR